MKLEKDGLVKTINKIHSLGHLTLHLGLLRAIKLKNFKQGASNLWHARFQMAVLSAH
jgi:hypothetical protein